MVPPHARHLAITRTARYYTLGDEHESLEEVWFLLHGYGQLAGQFIRYFAEIDDGTRLLVAPEALNRFYLVSPNAAPAADRPVGATWMTREDRDSEIGDYVAYLEQLHERVLARLAQPPARIVVLGFSQGAATAARWVDRGAARPDALVLWGGLLPPDIDLSLGAQAISGVPLTILVGSEDPFITPAQVDAQEAALRAHGVPYAINRYDGKHAIHRAVLRELARAISASGGADRRTG